MLRQITHRNMSRLPFPDIPESERGLTPLHLAVERRDLEMVDFLLLKGVSVEALNMDLMTPLHLAADNGSFDVVTSLLESLLKSLRVKVYTTSFDEADYRANDSRGPLTNRASDTGDERGKTALHYAAEHGELIIVKSLVYCGATLDKEDRRRRTPRDHANQKRDIYQFLKTEEVAQGIENDLDAEDFQDDDDLFEED